MEDITQGNTGEAIISQFSHAGVRRGCLFRPKVGESLNTQGVRLKFTLLVKPLLAIV